MELILDINMNIEDFATFKDNVFKAARGKDGCEEGIQLNFSSNTPQEWLDKCGGHLAWLSLNGIDVVLKGFVYCEGDLDIAYYKHPLPEGFTHCEGYLDLCKYNHPLPPSFTRCGGDLFSDCYQHPLPNGFKSKTNHYKPNKWN